MSLLNKLKFIWKKPKVVIVTGNGRACAAEAISQVLKEHFKIDNEILIFETGLKNSQDFENLSYLVKKSPLVVLVVTHIGDIPFDKDFFAGEKGKTIEIRKLAKLMPAQGYLVLNFDDETVREIKDETNLKELTFGFQVEADFQASDIKLNTGTNFKINYKGNIVPIWLEKLFGKEQIYAALAAIAVGTIFGLNLVEISQALKSYQSLPGKMRLIEGRNHSQILDDSESATVFSMVEAVEILGKIQGFKRKIAVLGDVVGIGKYTVEAHEAIGERVAKSSDLLFTFGERAKFIAQGAIQKGMTIEKIFQFDTIDEGKLKLREEIKEGDLILVDGSKEMEMGKIVEEIKAPTPGVG
jgi:UDP-N-acetylmuramoyl-tripeptide--D-alanyl-D-alanine ligase